MRWYRNAGLFLFLAATQLVICLMLAEATYPDYSISSNYISDLGVGPSPAYWIFNISVIVFGLMAIYSGYLIDKDYGQRLNAVLLVIAGIGAVGVGLFHEDIGVLHVIMAFLAFFFGGLSAVFSYKLVKPPYSCVAMVLGVISIVALILQGANVYLGLGAGGMERMIFYPVMLWAIGIGGYLMGERREVT